MKYLTLAVVCVLLATFAAAPASATGIVNAISQPSRSFNTDYQPDTTHQTHVCVVVGVGADSNGDDGSIELRIGSTTNPGTVAARSGLASNEITVSTHNIDTLCAFVPSSWYYRVATVTNAASPFFFYSLTTEYQLNELEAGPAGDDGFNSLVAITAESAGVNCANGGQKVDSGLDDDRDGVLDAGEIDDTAYVCNGLDGADGADGVDGFSSVFTFTNEPSGANCIVGGFRIDAGLDNGDGGGTPNDGILQAGEIDTTSYACNGNIIQGNVTIQTGNATMAELGLTLGNTSTLNILIILGMVVVGVWMYRRKDHDIVVRTCGVLIVLTAGVIALTVSTSWTGGTVFAALVCFFAAGLMWVGFWDYRKESKGKRKNGELQL